VYLKIVLIISTATLGVAFFAVSSENFRVLMQFLVSTSATLMVFHAMRSRAEYLWAATFCVIAVLFNPVSPFVLPGRLFVPLDLICMVLFFGYCSSYKSEPSLAMPSAIDRTPRQH
jgi:hypothetical protein